MTGSESPTMKRTSLALAQAILRNVTACNPPLQPQLGRGPLRLALLLCAAAGFTPACWADAELASAQPSSAVAPSTALAASAHLNFRITILPSLSLRSDALGQLRAQSNNGPLVMQGAALAAAPTAAGASSASRAGLLRGPVAALSLQAEPDAHGRALVTVASP
jgi:hypothetical protein